MVYRRVCKQYIFRSYNIAVLCVLMKFLLHASAKKKKKTKKWRISNLALLWVVFKWHQGVKHNQTGNDDDDGQKQNKKHTLVSVVLLLLKIVGYKNLQRHQCNVFVTLKKNNQKTQEENSAPPRTHEKGDRRRSEKRKQHGLFLSYRKFLQV